MTRKSLVPDRVRGALLGLAVGDALGTTLEFQRPEVPPFPALITGPHTHPLGGGPFEVAPGEVTDDTHMACCLAASLHEWSFFAPNFVVEAYADWMEVAFDIGHQTRVALSGYRSGLGPLEAGFRAWELSGFEAAGNGSLMRTAPIGVLYAQDALARRRSSVMDSSFTHADPRCGLACAAFNAAIAEAVTGAQHPEALLEAAASELPQAADHLLHTIPELAPEHLQSVSKETWAAWPERVQAALDALSSDLDAARQPTPGLNTDSLHVHDHQGFVRVAFRLAFWQLVHRQSFHEGLVDTVNRGGDADTNGAVVGALFGAFHGVGAIPGGWQEAVLSAVPQRLSPSAAALYHPRVLLHLASRMLG